MHTIQRFFPGFMAVSFLLAGVVHCGGVNDDVVGAAPADDDGGSTIDAGRGRDSGTTSSRDGGAAIASDGGTQGPIAPDDPLVYGLSSNGVYTSLILYSFNVVTSELKNLADFTVGSTQDVWDLAVDENGNFFVQILISVTSGGVPTYETYRLTIDSATRSGSLALVAPTFATSHVSSFAFRNGSPSLVGGGNGSLYSVDLSKGVEAKQNVTLPSGDFYDDLTCMAGGVCWEDLYDLETDGGSSGTLVTFPSDLSSGATTYMDHTGGYCRGLAYAKGIIVCFGSDNTIRKIDLGAPFAEFQSVFPTGDPLPASYAWLGGGSSSTHK